MPHLEYAASRTANGVQYWSVYDQVWRTAYIRCGVPDREYAAATEADRKLFDSLPLNHPFYTEW